jgi:hypothetical protein
MIQLKKVFLLFTITLLAVNLFPADHPSDSELKALMLANWERIEDYEVDIKLSLDIPGFRMPSRNIHYLYKAPDKSKVEVKGFAIVPKQGIQPFFTFLRDSLELQIVAELSVDGKAVFEVALEDTFMNEPGKISFYVEKETGSVLEAWVIHEKREFFRLKSEYIEFNGIQLPVSTNIQMTFPPDFKNLQRLGKKPTDMKAFDATITDEWLNGTVKISFKNYKVNRGIPDYRFEDEAEDTIQD